jgi:hypothetical protein
VQAQHQSSEQLSLLTQLQQLPPLLGLQHADVSAAQLPAQHLRALQGAASAALASGAHGGSASALQLAPLQQLAWALDAASSHSAAQEARTLAEQLPEALHELWFCWHDAQWPLGPQANAARPGTAARSAALAGLASGGGGDDADVCTWPLRVLQLRLAARHAARCSRQRPSLVTRLVSQPLA